MSRNIYFCKYISLSTRKLADKALMTRKINFPKYTFENVTEIRSTYIAASGMNLEPRAVFAIPLSHVFETVSKLDWLSFLYLPSSEFTWMLILFYDHSPRLVILCIWIWLRDKLQSLLRPESQLRFPTHWSFSRSPQSQNGLAGSLGLLSEARASQERQHRWRTADTRTLKISKATRSRTHCEVTTKQSKKICRAQIPTIWLVFTFFITKIKC